MSFAHTLDGTKYRFANLGDLLAKASPQRSGDKLAGIAARSSEERVAAQMALADVPLRAFLNDAVIPYERDEVTRLIIDSHDADAFAPVAGMNVGDLRDWLLSEQADEETLRNLSPGLTPEMAAAVCKIMRLQDLIAVAAKCRTVTAFRNTIGLKGRLSTRLQPNHPTDSPAGIAASIVDGLLYGAGDAVIGINPASDSLDTMLTLLGMLDEMRLRLDAPIQSCVLAHVTTAIAAMERSAPVDLVFQSIGGSEAANRAFGITLGLLDEARDAAAALKRGTVGNNVMYFETGQGSELSSAGHEASTSRPWKRAAMGSPAATSRCWSIRCRIHRPRISLRRQGNHPRRPGGSLLRQVAWPADGMRRLLHQPRRGGSGRHGRVAHIAGNRRLHVRHGSAGRGRYHAQLPEHVVSRCPLCP